MIMGDTLPTKKSKKGKQGEDYKPTKAERELVTLHARVGTPQEDIADILDITSKTLRKHYRRELDLSLYEANAKIGGHLYNKAIEGDTSAIMFWLKTRAGFRDNGVEKETEKAPEQVSRVVIEVAK